MFGSARTLEETWQLRAACRGPDSSLFFPPSHFERKEEKEFREERARAICKTCSVRRECLAYALRIREPHGIWGGLNEVERKVKLAARADSFDLRSSSLRPPQMPWGSRMRRA